MPLVKEKIERRTLRYKIADLENKIEELELVLSNFPKDHELPLRETFRKSEMKGELDTYKGYLQNAQCDFQKAGFKLGIGIPEETTSMYHFALSHLRKDYFPKQRGGDELEVYDSDDNESLLWARWNGEVFETLIGLAASIMTQVELKEEIKKM